MKIIKKGKKLKKENRFIIGVYVFMVIFEIAMTIIHKDFICIFLATLWGSMAISEYINAKIQQSEEELIEMQDNTIKLQFDIINSLLDEIKNRKVLKITDIKIPQTFKEPAETKLKDRFEYFKRYEKFKKPVIVDENNNLIDGYTSYIIAQKNNMSHVEVLIRKGGNKYDKKNM